MVEIPKIKSSALEKMDRARETEQNKRQSYRLGPSSLGEECKRKLWYSFRWVSPPEDFNAKSLRIFETGHIYEERLINELKGAGFAVQSTDERGKQIGFAFADGHGYGKLDGEILGLPEAPKTIHVLECKSSNQKDFNPLCKKGIMQVKPLHYAQVQLYMLKTGRDRAYYICVNKNTDELYDERIRLDHEFATSLELKAFSIVEAVTPPLKLHQDPKAKAAFACRFCRHKAICHEQAMPELNCRTCVHSTPVSGGNWECEFHQCFLDRAEQEEGCTNHLFIPELIPGEQIDANIDQGWIEYKMHENGRIWRNGVQEVVRT